MRTVRFGGGGDEQNNYLGSWNNNNNEAVYEQLYKHKNSAQQKFRVVNGKVLKSKGVNLCHILLAMVMELLVLGPDIGECAFGIQLNPCTLSQCIAECKKALQEKYLSATCASGSQGKFCICPG
ncbi:hypothetical protein Patl1_01262 [Pistacia atlantica]|uniref:Uncharacterized protein n=1 Tax=Pistacia atlantica TaxID=434234 RepID=A0ACC1C469_9ROSI|nr:hypothetical protein Patl1_01262 [Pistacia atlantica]